MPASGIDSIATMHRHGFQVAIEARGEQCGVILADLGELLAQGPLAAQAIEPGGAGQGGSGGGPPESDASPPETACLPARSPLRRLTTFELNNTLRDLLGDTGRPADSLPFDSTNDADTMTVSSVWVDRDHALSHELAIEATQDGTALNSVT